ncbi:MAG: AmmeMemoRadiSam system protein A [Candidatus Aminicenantales bacterium]
MSDFLNDTQKKFLLDLARAAVTAKIRTGRSIEAETDDPVLRAKRGVFVTLKVDGELRGCIGYPLPHKPLAEAVVEMAVAAATQDYRFDPLVEPDLDRLRVEISVLTVPLPVKDPREIIVGKHGIIVSKGHHKGLLLPQVPEEYHWDLETYLRHGCLKAGLPENDWKKGAALEVFEAQVFSE